MPSIELPPYKLLERLFTLVATENAELLPCCRWLVLGPRLARFILPTGEPTLTDLTALLRLLNEQAPDLQVLGKTLLRYSKHREDVVAELCVDQLLEHASWEHPSQVLERPRPDLRKLLVASQARLKRARGKKRTAVKAMTAKVERAVLIDESARKRRERMRKRRTRRR